MYMIVEVSQYVAVASFSEAWIEIHIKGLYNRKHLSPPSRRRGLKYTKFKTIMERNLVASFSEAWIEIYIANNNYRKSVSPPSRRRGLKYQLM